MLSNIRRLGRIGFLRLGLDIRRVKSIERLRIEQSREQILERWRFLKNYDLKCILDIGANTGQFAAIARGVLPTAKIISFEPLATCFAELERNLQQLQPAEGFCCALGEENGTAKIHHNAFAPSSSLLQMKDMHWGEMPETMTASEEEITVCRLDDVFATRTLEEPFAVKIDVQGFEDRVLKGGRNTIGRAVAVVLEMSSFRLYEGQPLFDDLYKLLREWGFVYRGNVDQWISRHDGRILQFDGLFENDRRTDTNSS